MLYALLKGLSALHIPFPSCLQVHTPVCLDGKDFNRTDQLKMDRVLTIIIIIYYEYYRYMQSWMLGRL